MKMHSWLVCTKRCNECVGGESLAGAVSVLTWRALRCGRHAAPAPAAVSAPSSAAASSATAAAAARLRRPTAVALTPAHK